MQKDDSYINCASASARGWHTVHLVEPEIPSPQKRASEYQISHLSQLHDLFPQFLKDDANGA
jgi:pyrimidine and pyridine-specific 5'-nucleotidase